MTLNLDLIIFLVEANDLRILLKNSNGVFIPPTEPITEFENSLDEYVSSRFHSFLKFQVISNQFKTIKINNEIHIIYFTTVPPIKYEEIQSYQDMYWVSIFSENPRIHTQYRPVIAQLKTHYNFTQTY